jgi:endonuclease YncB( thermonuclease family)
MTAQPPAPVESGAVPSIKVNGTPAPVKPIAQAPDGSLVTSKGAPVKPTATFVVDGASGSPVGVTRNVQTPKELENGKRTTLVQADPKALKAGDSFKAKMTWVSDGDTGALDNGVVCRISGIDAPETAKPKNNQPAQAYSAEAKMAFEQMVKNKELTVHIIEPPKEGKNYGRAACVIEVEGKDLNMQMLQQGMAWFWGNYVKDSFRYQAYQAAEADAKKSKRGLWKDPNPVFPNTYQRQYR